MQLAAGLVPDLPRFSIPPEWKEQQRLWGHSFHPMCSYLAMFPAALAHAFIARYSRPGDVVLDPFSGRGTTPLQACVEGRIGVGNDLNPFAYLLTAAKVDPPTQGQALARLSRLRIEWSQTNGDWLSLARRSLDAPGPNGQPVPPAGGRGEPEPVPHEVAVCFAPQTLAQVLFLRHELNSDDQVDRFLAAAITGILQGSAPSYLSRVMPNSFSMAPRYVRDFVLRTGLVPVERDAFGCLEQKLRRLYRQPAPEVRGLALLGDARDVAERMRGPLRERALPERARLVLTSPPYLRVVKYGSCNWLRLWFLGISAEAVDGTLDDAHHRAPYLTFLRESLAGLRPALADDAVVVLVIGDVEMDRGRAISDGVGLAEAVWTAAAQPEGYLLAGVAIDDIAAHRKMTRIWGSEAGRATRTDRLLVISPTEVGRRRALASVTTPIDWNSPRPSRRTSRGRSVGMREKGSRLAILGAHEVDVPPRRSRGDGPPGADEESGPRTHDQPPVELHPAAAGPPLRP
ncbi:MAG: hypothetical protein H0V12_08085 [Chloroflexi bacterium]|nr:hypothetical protein [Chloroflexota bacterium]